MGMSTEVVGFVPPDEAWQKMKAVWDACVKAGVPVPEEVDDFFEGETPDPEGHQVQILSREWSDTSSSGLEVVIANLPPHVKVIRFYNSW